MGIEIPPSLGLHGNEKIAMDILQRIWGKKPLFTCTVANTLTSTMPGISEAGDTPELTMMTPVADAELLVWGKVLSMDGLPVNPGNIPTPALLTRAAIDLCNMPFMIVNGGCRQAPLVPYIDVGGKCGRKIIEGRAVETASTEYERGILVGENLASVCDYLVISESCAGGTTTALAVLMAMGVISENLVSSSSPKNPKALKTETVMKALEVNNLTIGSLRDDPLKAIELVGDPMMPANVGILIGAARHIPVIVGGGTQLTAVIAAAVKMEPNIVGNIMQGTTRWLLNDPNASDLKIMNSISPDIPVLNVQMDYSKSPYEGLRAYEQGFIKEGVGCGGASIAAIIASEGKITCDDLLDRVHQLYRATMGL